MKILITYLLMLSLSLLTACGGSGGSSAGGDDSPAEPDPIIGDPNEGPKDDPVIPNDLGNLADTIVSDVDENQRVALTIEEYKDTNSYAFTGIDGDNVELSSADGKVVFKVEADFETQPIYNFIMTVTNASDQTKDINVTINIIDILEDLNSLPSVMTEEANENNRFAFTIPEYKDTNSYVFTGTDADKVKLWPERGEVIFNNAPDFESKAAYNFVMTVTNEMEQTKEIDVTVNIKDVSNDFIFEVLEGSEGELSLVINHDAQEMFDDYSFEIYKGDDENPEFDIDRSGNVAEERIVLKGWDAGMGEVQRYTIKPTSTNGLPGVKIRPNHAVVKIKVIQWGDNAWKSLNDMFSGVCFTGDAYNALSLSFSEELGAPNLSETTNMSSALSNCDFVDNLSYWDTSNAINMEKLFWLNDLGGILDFDSSFNTDLSQWDTSSVENMERMFNGAEMFDQDISDWDVDNVTECENFKEGALLLSDAYTPDFQTCSVLPSP